jgi:hypothetical protein
MKRSSSPSSPNNLISLPPPPPFFHKHPLPRKSRPCCRIRDTPTPRPRPSTSISSIAVFQKERLPRRLEVVIAINHLPIPLPPMARSHSRRRRGQKLPRASPRPLAPRAQTAQLTPPLALRRDIHDLPVRHDARPAAARRPPRRGAVSAVSAVAAVDARVAHAR